MTHTLLASWLVLVAAAVVAVACDSTGPPPGDGGTSRDGGGTVSGSCVSRSGWTFDAYPSICTGWCGSLVLSCHPDTDCVAGNPTVIATCPHRSRRHTVVRERHRVRGRSALIS